MRIAKVNSILNADKYTYLIIIIIIIRNPFCRAGMP